MNTKSHLTPYQTFTTHEWSQLRSDTPMTLSASDIESFRSLNDPISMKEVEEVYLPLSRLLSMYHEATTSLFEVTKNFISTDNTPKTPFIVGVAGSVSVGKSTSARVLRSLLQRWSSSPKVDLITTDGFLKPNARLEEEGLMDKKGFPESYDRQRLLTFLNDIKGGREDVQSPVYSHLIYDIVPNSFQTVDKPDILILEGLNILQVSDLPKDGVAIPFVSDFLDFSVYMDADEKDLEAWYITRFMRLRETAFKDKKSYFHRYSMLSDKDAISTATTIWKNINLANLQENILPTRPRADLVITKNSNHEIETVSLRKL